MSPYAILGMSRGTVVVANLCGNLTAGGDPITTSELDCGGDHGGVQALAIGDLVRGQLFVGFCDGTVQLFVFYPHAPNFIRLWEVKLPFPITGMFPHVTRLDAQLLLVVTTRSCHVFECNE
jgi:hypothetical protein